MTSYRTLVFSAVAFVCAASPALADCAHAMPGPVSSAATTLTSIVSGIATVLIR
jgi:hypothetical protein